VTVGQELQAETRTIATDLRARFPGEPFVEQPTRDGIPTFWVSRETLPAALRFLKSEVTQPYPMLWDLTAIDERERRNRDGQPASDFTAVYHLLSFARNADVRLKVALTDDAPSMPSITGIWPSADWYEREVWDMFGLGFEGHPNLRRILSPPSWVGHPLRKEHPARATDMGPFTMPPEKWEREEELLKLRPADWGLKTFEGDDEVLFVNVGPQHPGTHGVLRLAVALRGEEIVDIAPDIGYHHRGQEKMGERQTWHTYIPYTDRVDYLAGVMNNLAYLLSVEKLAGIETPDRVNTIRVMMVELFRISSHLVWYGTFAQDVGSLSPVFFMFTDREKLFDIVEAICGGRMHPNWFRIGGLAQDLPQGWDGMMKEFLAYMPKRLRDYEKAVMKNRIFKGRTQGVGAYTREEAIDWGVTGPGLRACGVDWDFRKTRPYSGYQNFEFDVPLAEAGDCYARAQVRVEEIWQSLRIIQQCVDHMPAGPYKAEHPLATPPPKERTMRDIETLITHFLSVSWGPILPAGEAAITIEATKGATSYYLISDHGTNPYRNRIRSPSFAHMQMLPLITRGSAIADLLAILGAMDFVLADVDR
jgi:NADH-quinone oxidoreductase subunit C/D